MKTILIFCVLSSLITAGLCQVKGCPLCKVSFIEPDGTLTPADVTVGDDDFHDAPVSNLSERCYLPADAGPCFAHMQMYYYNSDSGRCETFVYGGCLGNDNRFATEDECNLACNYQGY